MAYAVGSLPSKYERITSIEMTWKVNSDAGEVAAPVPGAHVRLLSSVGLGVVLEVVAACSPVVAPVPDAHVWLLPRVGHGVLLEVAGS